MAASQRDSNSENWKMNIHPPARSSSSTYPGVLGGSGDSSSSGEGGDEDDEEDIQGYSFDFEDKPPMHVIQRMLPSDFSQDEDDEATDNGDDSEMDQSEGEIMDSDDQKSEDGSDTEEFGGFKTSSESFSDNEQAIASSSSDESIKNEENDFFRNDQLSDSEKSHGGNSEDEDDEEDDDFFDDFFDIETTLQSIPPEEHSFASYNRDDSENDSDSYLWEYFLTSDEDDTFGYVRGRRYSQVDGVPQEVSGDSTDEDDSVPSTAQRAQGTKAVEVLGVDTFSTRPPVLGQWDINDNENKQVGIIDGLTTRSLTPGAPQTPNAVDSNAAGSAGTTDKVETPQTDVTPTPKDNTPQPRIYSEALHSDSDYSDVELEEFMNTKEMDLDSDDDTSAFQSSADQRPKVPLSAFRNRGGAQGPQQMAFRRRRSSLANSGDFISPLKGLHRKKRQRVRKIPSPKMEPQENNNKDFVDELMEVNAISPLFGI